MQKKVLTVEGMSCNHCATRIQNSIGSIHGVAKVDVDLKGKTVSLEYENEEVTLEEIIEAIDDQGYEVKKD
ncbi:MAG TPA: heavy-metal-associated domain-containing protein [Peptococcaceae bacterium]|nr:heavy-metal-associated domain-containing protein [Peptococcaceae bacterium]